MTHYSLLYQFEHNPTPNGMMKCVLVPRVSISTVTHDKSLKQDVLLLKANGISDFSRVSAAKYKFVLLQSWYVEKSGVL